MKGKISYIDQKQFSHQAVNIYFSAVKLGILTWGIYSMELTPFWTLSLAASGLIAV